MATTLNTNLYPPIFRQSFLPAFIYTETCRIYFSLSAYNTVEDLSSKVPVQIVVQDQLTNQNALSKQKYPNRIKLSQIYKDGTRETDDKYYIKLSPEDIEGGFQLNITYKVQLRFTGAEAANPSSKTAASIDKWLNENMGYFSQWSTSMLIYGISQPTLSLQNFSSSETTNFTTLQIPIVGYVSFEDKDKETLRSYRIYLYQGKNLLQDSGNIYTDKYQATNQINYMLKYNLQIGTTYTLRIQIVTENLYSFKSPQSFKFKITSNDDAEWDINFMPQADNDSGCIKLILDTSNPSEGDESEDSDVTVIYTFEEGIDSENTLAGTRPDLTPDENISSTDTVKFTNNAIDSTEDTLYLFLKGDLNNDLNLGTSFYIRRSSGRTDFTIWEDIDYVTIKDANVTKLIWTDFTVEPGVWYKYKLVRFNVTGRRTATLETENPLMVVPEDIFLVSNGKQLKVRFNPSIDNFSIRKADGMIETIGSAYPFIRRNGSLNYKTFNLSGTITAFMDIRQNLMQASKQDVYTSKTVDLYAQYNADNRINNFNDYIYERQFRQKIMDFLYADNIKLFKSIQEGNILVRLMDISLTPSATLGRLIYSFSCTAYEVAQCNFENYQKYDIMTGSYKPFFPQGDQSSNEVNSAMADYAIAAG